MNTPEYSLPHSDITALARARRWLLLGVLSLGVAGVFAGMLGAPSSSYFYTALVVHVDLSVLVWFLTIACLFFTLAADNRGLPLVADAAFVSFAAGTILIALSAFSGGEPYMSNYIPVIHHPMFFLGLSFLLCGVLGSVFHVLAANWQLISDTPQQYGVTTAALMMLIALACFVWSQLGVADDLSGQLYYESVFWAGGHMLQFVHTQLMLVAWLWLASSGGLKVRFSNRLLIALFAIGLLVTFAMPLMYHDYDPTSDEHRIIFTNLMKHENGIAALVFGGILTFALLVDKWSLKLPCIALAMSILLFAIGGVLGYRIDGSNVTVPAHYHGSIVGITLAFMGVAYLLLPTFGWKDVSTSKLAMWQPIIYGGGQLCWMAGMAMLGSYGVPRKTSGSAEIVGGFPSFLKHGGDGLALIGGLLFVFIVLRAAYKKK